MYYRCFEWFHFTFIFLLVQNYTIILFYSIIWLIYFLLQYVTDNLISLLESLGTQSITAIELKQMIGLLRLDSDGIQVVLISMIL